MDITLLLKAALMGIVEGLTEFLPISSTGHLILAGSLLGFTDDKSKVFDIAIQTGAIFAVMLVYWQRLRETASGLGSSPAARRFVVNVAIGFFPAVVMGLLFGKAVKAHLFTPVVVASTFILGGFIILWAERRQAAQGAAAVRIDTVRPDDAARRAEGRPRAVPGAGAGHQPFGRDHHRRHAVRPQPQGRDRLQLLPGDADLDRRRRYSLYKERALLSVADVPLFGVGLLFSFGSAWLCVRWLLKYIASHDFVPFAYYRIVFGIVVLATAWSGLVTWSD